MKLFQKLINLLKQLQLTQTKYPLSGKEINLTSDNTIIKSTNFNVDKDGNMTCKSASMQDANINGGNIILKSTSYGQVLKLLVEGNEDTAFISTPQSLQFNYDGDDRADLGVNNSGNGFMSIVNSSGNSTNIHGEGITTPVLTQTSLESIKKNIEKANINALELIKNADIYEYNLKSEEDTEKKHIGFVIGDKYNTPNEVIAKSGEGIDTYSMSSIMWKAIQELAARVEQLEKEVANGKD